MNVNQVQLIRRVARDAEVRSLTTGGAVCSFTVVTNQFFLKEGKKVEQPAFHRVAAFGKTAELIAQYGKKGRLLMAEGTPADQLLGEGWADALPDGRRGRQKPAGPQGGEKGRAGHGDRGRSEPRSRRGGASGDGIGGYVYGTETDQQ